MSEFREFFQGAISAFVSIGVSDILDILIVAFIIFKLLSMVHTGSTARVAKAIVLLVLLTLVTSVAKMHMLNFILSNILSLGFIALVILFQPELRRVLERLGAKTFSQLVGGASPKSDMEEAILATVSACEIMSKERIGVLLVFERNIPLEEYFKTGTMVDARMSEQLLRNIFFPKAALHDGAIVIKDGRIVAARCVVPLKNEKEVTEHVGTRHRAAMEVSLRSDAIAVVTSEETGIISVAMDGKLQRGLSDAELREILAELLIGSDDENESGKKKFSFKKSKGDKTK